MQDRVSDANLTAGDSKEVRSYAEASITEEPGAIVSHAGICAGAGG